MNQPERPTCGTCPYWDGNEAREEGFCKRHTPRFAVTKELLAELNDSGMWDGVWPSTWAGEWCGEHPDFPAYLRLLKGERQTETSLLLEWTDPGLAS